MDRPDRAEAAEYYFTYINQVPEGDIGQILEAQQPEAVELLRNISEERSLHRYAPGKWSIREVVSHINDTERMFAFRALWFARGFDSPLPSFDQDIAIRGASADDRPLSSHVEEFRAVIHENVEPYSFRTSLFQSKRMVRTVVPRPARTRICVR